MSWIISLLLVGCDAPAPAPIVEAPVAPAAPVAPVPKYTNLFAPLPPASNASGPLVDLGRMLYYEPRLSRSQEISCNSCHLLDKYGVDNQPTSPGHRGQLGGRNSPTSYNASLQFAQFWDGRAATVEEQAKGPIMNPVEMAMTDDAAAVRVLKSIPGYGTAFASAFPNDPDPITVDNAAAAIGAFERGLSTPNSKFDRYLGGDLTAMSADEVAGLDLFVSTGCVTCHSGVLLGGAMYQKLGLVKPYETKDHGRMDLTKNEADNAMFKVPQLRNIAETGPYFHDGSVATLPVAVRTMAEYQLGKTLSDAEVDQIVGFLHTLTGELPTDYIALPKLPPSGPKTPRADKT